jgi:hypothetical protein
MLRNLNGLYNNRIETYLSNDITIPVWAPPDEAPAGDIASPPPCLWGLSILSSGPAILSST